MRERERGTPRHGLDGQSVFSDDLSRVFKLEDDTPAMEEVLRLGAGNFLYLAS